MPKESMSIIGEAIKPSLQLSAFHVVPGNPNNVRALSKDFYLPAIEGNGVTTQLAVHMEKLGDFVFKPNETNQQSLRITTLLLDPIEPTYDLDHCIGFRMYHFTIDDPNHITIKSSLRVNDNFQGYGIGEAWIMLSEDIITFGLTSIPEFSNKLVDAIISDFAHGNTTKNGKLPQRYGWSSYMALKLGYSEEPEGELMRKRLKKE